MHEQAKIESKRPAERRAEGRSATVFRPVLIEADGFVGFCLVRNLSPSGLMGRVYTSFAEGMPLRVQFHPDKAVDASVVWCKDGEVGLRFEEDIEVSQVLADLARSLVDGKINRAPRLQIQSRADLLIGKRTLTVDVQDISQRGVKVAASFVEPGDELRLRLQGLAPRKATVRWTQPGTAGLNFVSPLSFEELARWVIGQQDDSVAPAAARANH
jgi:hypothetical protein